MNRWTIKQLTEMSDISFAIAVLEERRHSTTNVYSPLNEKISKAIKTLRQIEETKDSRELGAICEKIATKKEKEITE